MRWSGCSQAEPVFDLPYSIVGHSLGALVGFELAREIERSGARPPDGLIVSAQRVPCQVYPFPPIFSLPESRFLPAFAERYQPLPAALPTESEARSYFARLLKADFELAEAYVRRPAPQLSCPIEAIRGADDAVIGPQHLDGWSDETNAACRVWTAPGGHEYFRQRPAALLHAILAAGPSDIVARHWLNDFVFGA